MTAGAGMSKGAPVPDCICCHRSNPRGGLLCYDCARPDPERVQELEDSDESSAVRRARWERDGRMA